MVRRRAGQFRAGEGSCFSEEVPFGGPIFNDYVIGGYLLWDLYPDYKFSLILAEGFTATRFFRLYGIYH